MGAKQVVLLDVSIYHTYVSQWMAEMCRRSRAQITLLWPKAQFPAIFEDHVQRSPCGLCHQDFVANMLTDLPDSATQY